MTTIHGQVVDPQGQPVADASVYIASAPVNMPDVAQLTDDQGRFVIAAPVPGSYVVGVRSDLWGLTQVDVDVSEKGPVTVEVRFTRS